MPCYSALPNSGCYCKQISVSLLEEYLRFIGVFSVDLWGYREEIGGLSDSRIVGSSGRRILRSSGFNGGLCTQTLHCSSLSDSDNNHQFLAVKGVYFLALL